jgi:transcriptional antiterminator/mannitol/fructose-specific phosphotransferase system IIA component
MIVSSNSPIMINSIAKKINISPRTVRNDLDKIDDYLNQIGFPKLERKPNVGVTLRFDVNEINKLFKILGRINNYDYVLSQKERVLYVLCDLLSKSGFITISSLSDKMMVSRSTIINDLNQVRQWLIANNLYLESSKGHGIKVSGDELDIRKAVVRILFHSMDTLTLININTIRLFKDIDIEFIKNTIKAAENQMESTFSDDAFNNLVIHIAIAVKRIKLSKDIIMDKDELKNLRRTAEFAISSGIARSLEEKFDIEIPEDEIGYITIHLLGSNITYAGNPDKDNWIYIHLITSTLIENVGENAGINFSIDNQLFDGLIQHIRPAIYRIKHGLKIKNPLINEIKCNFYDMFQNVRKSIKFIENEAGNSISEEEIGYPTLHFMASLERINNNYKKPNVLVVCATGIGTSRFVATKLKSIFDINIIDTISSQDIEKVLKSNNNIDLIVSTIPINVNKTKCIEVNTFLTEKNISDLSLFFAKFIKTSQNKTANSERNMIDRILDIITDNCTIKDYENLRNKLSAYLNINENRKSDKYKPSLKEIINIDCIKLKFETKSWEEAVRKSGQILMDNGCIEKSYIDAMVNTVKKVGPYIVVLPGIAMPHASPEDGVLKTGISILTLKNPISFGNKENDPVSVLIAISTINKLNHMNALKQLMNIIEKDDFVSKALAARNPEEILNLI